MFPNLLDFEEVNIFDLLQIATTIAIAIVALSVSKRSYKLSKQSVEHDIKKSAFEANLALYPQRIKILNSLYQAITELKEKDFMDEYPYLSEIQLTQHIFPKNIAKSITSLFNAISKYKVEHDFEDYYMKKYSESPMLKSLKNEVLFLQFKNSLRIEYAEIAKNCKPLVNLSNDIEM